MVDSKTGYLGCVPMNSKAQFDLATKEVTAFCQTLGYNDFKGWWSRPDSRWYSAHKLAHHLHMSMEKHLQRMAFRESEVLLEVSCMGCKRSWELQWAPVMPCGLGVFGILLGSSTVTILTNARSLWGGFWNALYRPDLRVQMSTVNQRLALQNHPWKAIHVGTECCSCARLKAKTVSFSSMGPLWSSHILYVGLCRVQTNWTSWLHTWLFAKSSICTHGNTKLVLVEEWCLQSAEWL